MTTLKPQKAQIKQLPWLALIIEISMKHPKTAPAKTEPVRYKIGGIGPTLMAASKRMM